MLALIKVALESGLTKYARLGLEKYLKRAHRFA
jgi:hypothetical protein